MIRDLGNFIAGQARDDILKNQHQSRPKKPPPGKRAELETYGGGKFHLAGEVELTQLQRSMLVGVTLVLNLRTLRDETLATTRTTATDNVTTCFGLHARAETVLIFA